MIRTITLIGKNGVQGLVLFVLTLTGLLAGRTVESDSAQAAPLLSPPYPPSPVITGISFDWSTHIRAAPGSDNWPITWAANGHQYTSWGDGGGFGGTNQTGRVSMGFARIEGDAGGYRGVNIWGGVNAEAPAQFTGKTHGVLAANGKLYVWRCGDGSMEAAFRFQQLYESSDLGHTWDYTGVEYTQSYFGSSRGFFCPTFLQFGKDYAGARDGYVYSYGPEIKSDVFDVMKPGEISLVRVPLSGLKDRSQYQFYTGQDSNGNPTWSANPAGREPVFADPTNGVMRMSATYNAGLGRYILIVEHTSRSKGNIGIYDGPTPWGPWTTVLFQSGWGSPNIEASTFSWYFSNKWTSADGRDFTMIFTGIGTNDSWNTVRGRFDVGLSNDTGSGQPTPTAALPTPNPTATPKIIPTATQTTNNSGDLSTTIRVNFQPNGAVPSGWLVDGGATYGRRDNGYSYGWNLDNQANTRNRNSDLSTNEQRDTLNHMQKDGKNYNWEVALPNGTYKVKVTAGDARYYNSVFKIAVEGTLVVNGTPSSTDRWVSGISTVTVTDGLLTVANAPGAYNNKINFIEIVPSTVSTVPSPTATPTSQITPTQPTAAPTSLTTPSQPTATPTSLITPSQPTPTPTPTVTSTSSGESFSARVNFQTKTSPPSRWLADSGDVYGDRGDDYSFGWNDDNQDNARNRNSDLSSNEQRDTLNHLQKDGKSYTWEIAVPNGTYKVKITAGDARFYNSIYKIEVEGSLVVNGIPNSTNRWITGIGTVTVSDGRLTVSSASGAYNNKINLIEIYSVNP